MLFPSDESKPFVNKITHIYIYIWLYVCIACRTAAYLCEGQLDNCAIVPPPVIAVPKGETLALFPERRK